MSLVEEEGVEISATPQSIKEEVREEEGLMSDQIEDEAPPDLGLGDRIQIESKKFGRVVGRVYYLDEELLRVLPDGVSNRLYDFPITAEGIDPELGVTEILTEPTEIASFVEQSRLRVGSRIDTFSAEGEERGSYVVDAVNPEGDSVILVNPGGDKEEVVFDFKGIPRDLPFEVLRVAPAEEETPPPLTSEEDEEITATKAEEEEEEEVLGEIEIPIIVEVSEIPASLRIFPETVQKNDLFVDLLTLVDTPSQKNPNILKKIRSVVEATNGLIRQVTEYAADGTPIGGKPASFAQIADLLRKANVPLSRPVLEAVRTLYLNHSSEYKLAKQEGTSYEEPPFTTADFDVNFNPDQIQRTEEAVRSATISASENPRLYTELNIQTDYLQRPWKPTGSSSETYIARSDKEFFRRSAPEDDVMIPGLNPIPEQKDVDVIAYYPDLLDSKVDFSILRAVGPTYRKTKTGRNQLAISSDRAPLVSHLLFPHSVANILGSTRTYNLGRDIGRSSVRPTNMQEILAQIGNVSEVPSAGSIINIGPEGNTFGNIDLSAYLNEILKQMPSQLLLGADDFRLLLTDLGLEEYELNLESAEVLDNRIVADIARLRGMITSLREVEKTVGEPTPQIQPFLDETTSVGVQHWLKADPTLSEDLEKLTKATPQLATTDLAVVAYLLKYHQDLFIAHLGRQTQIVETERLRANADKYLETVNAALKSRLRKQNAGAPPTPNACEHVKTLVTIRKVKDDAERLALLAKFVSRFQGQRNENYVDCIVCDKHLLCMHEILQIQMALRPREQEVLQKELYLNMGGGSFHGAYICRNCGQTIAELQFDQSIEFTDDGAPINGQALVIDPDEVEEEQLGLQLGAFVPGTDDLVFDNEAKTLCYNVAKEIYQRVGIYPDLNDYRNVVEAAFQRIQTLESREDYEKKRKAGIAKGMKNIPDYDTYIKGFTVTSVAALILIDIQTHVPDYVVRYTLPGCEAGFGGFPLQGGDKRTGVNYISCAVGSITKNEEPWNRTGFLAIRSDESRRNVIAKFMEQILTKILATEPSVQQKISAKIEYLRETFGAEAAEGRPSDKIPFGFLPLQAHVKADDPVVVPEAAKDQRQVAAAWIREAHKHALRTAQLVRGNPFAETACCFGPIMTPGDYWTQAKLGVVLAPRDPPKSPLYRNSILFVHFIPKSMTELLVEAPLNLAFRIFLKVCYTGPRIGYAHELGYNGVCDNCGLKLSTKFLFPDYSLQTSKKASQPIVDTAELISDLQAQGVNVTPEFFQQILDQSHLNYLVPPVRANKITPVGSLLARLGDLEPAPVEGWRVHLADLITKLGTLQKDANETDVALAYGSISEVAAEADQFVKRRLGSTYSIIEKWINNDTKQLFEIVLAYLITPLQRLITRYDIDKLKTPRIYDLAPGHQDDLNKVLAAHTENLKKFSGSFTTGLAAAKVSYFLDQIQGLAEFAQEIQPARTPGGEIGSRYLKKILFLGPFAELLDFNRVPPVYKGDVAAESLVDKSGSTLVAFLGTCFKHFMGESLSYSPDEVRLRIAKAKEKEKMNIIEDLDAMEEDAKRVELVKKVLGIGRWAIGGSKLIYAYDQDQYEKERDERVRRGETDLPYELGTTAPGNNQVFDIFTSGNAGAPDAFYEAQGGYDVAQESSDDF